LIQVFNNIERITDLFRINYYSSLESNRSSNRKTSLHDFRRAFALKYFRNSGDIFSSQKLIGHADLQAIRGYLTQTTEDSKVAHNHFSPGSNSEQ